MSSAWARSAAEQVVAVLQGVTEALEELGQYDAAVTTGTEKGPLGQLPGDISRRQFLAVGAAFYS